MNTKRSKFLAYLLTVALIVMMTAVPVYAKTNWTLNGWRYDQDKWIGGNLFTYFEDEYVPYRLDAKTYELDTSPIKVDHDYQDANGHFGVDGAADWFIGPLVSTSVPLSSIPRLFEPGPATFTVSHQIKPISNGSIIEYTLTPTQGLAEQLAALGEWTLYWKAHLSKTGSKNLTTGEPVVYGSSYWNGASLHAHTSVTGRSDVPIATPPQSVTPSISVTKTANPTTLPEPGGNVTFTVTVQNTSDVTLTLTSLVDDVYGNLNGKGTISLPQTLLIGGSYTGTFSAPISGDAGYVHLNTVTATAFFRTLSATASDDATVTITDVPPSIEVIKTANPTSVPETGGNVTFTFQVRNTGAEAVTLTSLVDNRFGDLNGQGNVILPVDIPVGGSVSFTVTKWLASDSLIAHNNIVTATAVDNEGTQATDSDDATVTFTDVAPAIRVTKTANPASVPETGGNVTFTFLVENTGVEDVTLNSLVDDRFGNLNGQGNVVLPVAIPVGGHVSFSVIKWLASDSLTAHTNVVTATATDDDGTPATDTDDATVTFTNVMPAIKVTKTANPIAVPETGGDVTFTFLIENIGVEAVTLTSLTDDTFGDLNGQGNVVLPVAIPVGGSVSFTVTKWLASDSLEAHTNVVTATAEDNEKNEVTDTDDATVTFTNVAPAIQVTKTANPTAVPETGGDVTFTFLIENIGTESVTLTDLMDDQFGNLNGQGNVVLPVVIPVGGNVSFSVVKMLASDSLTPHTNVVTATAEDGEGTVVHDSDDATVTFTDVAPQIQITKTANPTAVPETGGLVTFTILVENIGVEDVTLTSLLDDQFGDLQGIGTVILPVFIPVGGSYSAEFVSTLSSDTLTPHTNVITATAIDDDGTPATADDDATVTFTNVLPTVTIDKTANPGFVPETGGDVTFTFVITNTGTEAITVTALVDDVFGNLLATAVAQNGGAPIVLAPLGTFSFSIVRTLSSEDLADHVNTVTVTAVDNEQTTATDTDDATVLFSAIRLVKSGVFDAGSNGLADVGELITFTFTVTNPGKVDLTNVTITDDKVDNIVYVSGDTNADDKLQSTETWIFQGTYPVTQADIDLGTVYNMATASSDETEDDTDDATVLLDQEPALSIDKQVANLTQEGPLGDLAELKEGETAIYSITVTNTGNVTLHHVMLTDSEVAPGTEVEFEGGATGAFDSESKLNLGTLEPGESITLTYLYETVFADIARSSIENVATASALIDDEETLQVSDFAIIDVTAIPLGLSSIEIKKQVKNATANGLFADLANGFAGDTFTFKVTVTNAGTTKLSDVILTDDAVTVGTAVLINGGPTVGAFIDIGGVPSIVIGEMEAGASVTYTYDYVSKAADIGEVMVNTASVHAVYKPEREGYENVPLEDEASATFTVVGIPITGETGTNRLLIGLGLILAGLAVWFIRRRQTRGQMEI